MLLLTDTICAATTSGKIEPVYLAPTEQSVGVFVICV